MVADGCMRRHLENKPVAVEATQRSRDKACRLRHARFATGQWSKFSYVTSNADGLIDGDTTRQPGERERDLRISSEILAHTSATQQPHPAEGAKRRGKPPRTGGPRAASHAATRCVTEVRANVSNVYEWI